MQSEDDWDDDWDDEDESDSNLPRVIFTNMRIAIGATLVIFLLLCSMIFTNFGF